MKRSIGYFYSEKYKDEFEEKLMSSIDKRTPVLRLPIEEILDFEALEKKVKGCGLIINYAAAEPCTFEALEIAKTFEEMGIEVINSSHSFYYQEDKWMFYLKCLEHGLPTPKTHFIPKSGHNEKIIRSYLKAGPLVLKAIFSDKGLCVEKANSLDQFKGKLSKIISKNPISPIIAQEYIDNSKHKSIRVTLAGYEAVQAIAKYGKSWKQTGSDKKEHFRRVKLSSKIIKDCEKAARAFGMEICGLDLILSGDRWHIIEANSVPGLSWIKSDERRVIDKIADYAAKKVSR